MTTMSAVVCNELGLHARTAARFVRLATSFASQIRVGHETQKVDGKSILSVLLLAAGSGTTLTITADGPDETVAAAALATLVESGLGEKP